MNLTESMSTKMHLHQASTFLWFLITKKLNLQTTPTELLELSETETVLMEMDVHSEKLQREMANEGIKKQAPPWFTCVFDFLLKDLDYLRSQAMGLEECKVKCEENSKEIETLQRRLREAEQKNEELQDQVNKLEDYSRKDNLIIKGIAETGPNENAHDLVVKFFKDSLMLSDPKSVVINNVHRLGKPPHLTAKAAKNPRDIIFFLITILFTLF